MQVSTISEWKSYLEIKFHKALKVDNHFLQVVASLQSNNITLKFSKYVLNNNGIIQFDRRIYVRTEGDLKKNILQEMHNVPYAGRLCYHNTL